MKTKLLYFLFGFLTVLLVFLVYYQSSSQGNSDIYDIEKKYLTIEYGCDYDLSNDIKVSDSSKLPSVNTYKLGEQHFYVLDKYELIIKVEDTTPPVIKLVDNSIQIEYGTNFNPMENIKRVYDPVDGDVQYSFISSVDTTIPGNYEVHISAEDRNGNVSEKSYLVEVLEKKSEKNEISKQEGNYKETIVPYYKNGVLLVNKNHPLPRNFGGLDNVAYNALINLQAKGRELGLNFELISGYRSYDYQKQLYNAYVERNGQAAADRYSARPGYSEHQSGLAFDVGELSTGYGESESGIYLANHAHEYGFIIRYPIDGESITGYMYEPWHIRYVGVEIATEIYNQGITLEEYLGE